MAFPTIPTVAAGRVLILNEADTTATRTSANLSSLTKNAGDLLILIVVAYQTSTGTDAAFSGWSGSFTEFGDRATSTTMAIGAAYKWSTGSETGAINVTQAATITGHATLILLSIPGAHATTPPEISVKTNSTAAPPAVATALDPTGWGAEDTLWIAVGGSGETATTGSYTAITAAPTNYTDLALSGITADVVGGINAGVAFRQLNAASEAPGAWTADTSNVRGSSIVIAVRPAALSNADAEVAWAETEVPNAQADAEVSWAELEVPTAGAQAQISWVELEVPTAGADAEVSWSELEVPDLAVNADAEVAWAELEVPQAADAEIAWAEFEVPSGQSDGEVSFTEFEVPTAGAQAEISWVEFEVPTAGAQAEISWAEVEVPTAGAQAEVAWADFEVPDLGGGGGDFLEDEKHIIHHSK